MNSQRRFCNIQNTQSKKNATNSNANNDAGDDDDSPFLIADGNIFISVSAFSKQSVYLVFIFLSCVFYCSVRVINFDVSLITAYSCTFNVGYRLKKY